MNLLTRALLNRPSASVLRGEIPFIVQDLETLASAITSSGALNNISAVAPTVANDNTQGYSSTSFWLNTVTGFLYICTSAATGAAVWQNVTALAIADQITIGGTGTTLDPFRVISVAPTPGVLNHIAAVPPTVNDDSGDGYAVTSYWFDTVSGQMYVCTDATAGAAVWQAITITAGSVVVGDYAFITGLSGFYVLGAQYFITDRADAGILMKAIDADHLEPACTGLFYNADFDNLSKWDFSQPAFIDAQPIVTLQLSSQSGAIANGDIATSDQNSAIGIVTDDSDQNNIKIRVTASDYTGTTSITLNTAVTATVDSMSSGVFSLNQNVNILNGILVSFGGNSYTRGSMGVRYVRGTTAINVADILTLANGAQFYVANIAGGASYSTGDIRIWNNRHYKALTNNANWINPSADTTNWVLLAKDDIDNPMVLVSNAIAYDIVNDAITGRENILSDGSIQIDRNYINGSLVDWGNANSHFEIGGGYVEAQNCTDTQTLTVSGQAAIYANNNAGDNQVLTATEYGQIEANFNSATSQALIANGIASTITANRNVGDYQAHKATENAVIQADDNAAPQTLIASGYAQITADNNANNQDITAIEDAEVNADNNSGYGQYLRATGYGQIQADNNSATSQTITVNERGEVNADNNSGSDQFLYADGTSFLTANNNTSGAQAIRSVGRESYVEATDNGGGQRFEARNNGSITANNNSIVASQNILSDSNSIVEADDNAGSQTIVSDNGSIVTANDNGGSQKLLSAEGSSITANTNGAGGSQERLQAKNASTIVANNNAGAQVLAATDYSTINASSNDAAGDQNYMMMAFSSITDNGNILTVAQVKVNDTIII